MTTTLAHIMRYYRRVHAVLDSIPDGLPVRESDHLADACREMLGKLAELYPQVVAAYEDGILPEQLERPNAI
jgi:hypothetical protein